MSHGDDAAVEAGWRGLCRIGGFAALGSLACSLVTMVVLLVVGPEAPPPEEAPSSEGC